MLVRVNQNTLNYTAEDSKFNAGFTPAHYTPLRYPICLLITKHLLCSPLPLLSLSFPESDKDFTS
jgi:hypothetical protein